MHHASAVAEIVAGIIILLLIAAAVLALAKRLRLPFTVLLVVTGIAISTLASHYRDSVPLLQHLALSPDLILYIFLPTLIFESSFNLDVRQLQRNMAPIAILAIPGLILSTTLIGLIVHWATPIPLLPALLLGAILSATDPVAVVALFKQLGAPQRLTVIVEGESLFNDATSIVAARILIGVIAAGTLDNEALSGGLVDFFLLFFGGLLCGLLLGALTAYLLGLVETDPFIEITLTTVVAYLSFLVAEELLGVSGVMATMGAGLMVGGWGRIKISPQVRGYLEHFWEQLAFIANALIFLMVGMRVELGALWDSLDLLGWVVVAMLLARAAIIYLLMPLMGRLPGAERVSLGYQTVMFWGGLRGAIAIAIALSLPHFDYAETFLALVMGAVLFTLLAQALTIEPLIRLLGLNRPPLTDRLALLERDLLAKEHTLERIPQLEQGGLLSAPRSRHLQQQCQEALHRAQQAIDTLRRNELTREHETALLYLRALSVEKRFYDELYAEGHLSEGAYRELVLILILQIDAIRFGGSFEHIHSHRVRRLVEHGFYRLLDRFALLAPVAEQLRMRRLVRNYENVWGHFQGSGQVLRYLDELARLESTPPEIVAEVRGRYQHWQQLARQQLDLTSENFPEFVTSMQERLGRRLTLLAEVEATAAQIERGMLPKGVGEALIARLNDQLRVLRGENVEKLRLDPHELLQKVPLLRSLDHAALQQLVAIVHPHTVEAGSTIIAQGEYGESLYLIARGVVRVTRHDDEQEYDLGTLMAGDFFGEMALLHHERRSATVRAISPCMLYELRRAEFDAFLQRQPQVVQMLQQTDAQRHAAQQTTTHHMH